MSKPEKVAIDPDGGAARHVGRTPDGDQFFVTSPFEPALTDEGCEYFALYRFDADGNLKNFEIVTLGPRRRMDEAFARREHARLLDSLGPIGRCRIEVRPFEVMHDGRAFGLILRLPEEEDDPYVVEAMPGNYMAFFEPWDSGEYDT